jgi:hypothetical protein
MQQQQQPLAIILPQKETATQQFMSSLLCIEPPGEECCFAVNKRHPLSLCGVFFLDLQ